MGRKKQKAAEKQRIFCYYCEKDGFEDEGKLLQHQRQKHFKCPTCSKRFVNVPGMGVHMQQVHQEELKIVPNAIEGRDKDLKTPVSGMQCVPYHKIAAEAAARANKRARIEGTGEQLPGAGTVAPHQQFSMPAGLPPPRIPMPGMLQPMAGAAGLLPPPSGIPPPGMPMPAILQTKSLPGFNVPGMLPTPFGGQNSGAMRWPQQAPAPFSQPPAGMSSAAVGTAAAPQLPATSASANTTQPRGTVIASSAAAAAPTTVSFDAAGGAGLVYSDELTSMEERRASLDRYRYDEAKIKQQLAKLDDAIAARLGQALGR